jgi:4-hydroxy 2-oxovalerate aldolase
VHKLTEARPVVLDATLRDGGYLNDWQFTPEHVDKAVSIGGRSGADIVEVGYLDDKRNLPEAAACRPPVLERIRSLAGTALLAAMIRPSVENPEGVLSSRVGLVDLLRIPVDLRRPGPAIDLAERARQHGFQVTLNFTSVSCFAPARIGQVAGEVPSFVAAVYLADSRGALVPGDIPAMVSTVREVWSGAIGYHAHNNLGNAISNTEQALESGCEFIDGSIAGVGLGGRNLRLTDAIAIATRYREDLPPEPNSLCTTEDAIGMPVPGEELSAYRLAAEKNIRQEWVEPMMRALGRRTTEAVIAALPKRCWFELEELEQLVPQKIWRKIAW